MANQANGKIVDDVEERGEVEYVFADSIGGTRRPCAIAVAAKIQSIDVVVLAQRARDPVPVAGVVESAVD